MTLPGLADPDDDDDPPIQRVRMVTERALEKGLPVLGVCLGSQLLAQVLGGSGAGVHGRAPLARLPYVGSGITRLGPSMRADTNRNRKAQKEAPFSGICGCATRRNHLRRNGKEGVNGSSPLEGFPGFAGN